MSIAGSTVNYQPFGNPPGISPGAAEARARTPFNTLTTKRASGVRIPTADAIRPAAGVESWPSFGSGGSTWPGVERHRPLAGEIAPTTPDSVQNVLRGQAPASPLSEMSLNSPMFNVNDALHIVRTPTSFSSPGLDSFDIGTAMFIRKQSNDTSVWKSDRRLHLQSRGRHVPGEDTMMSLCALNALLFKTQTKRKWTAATTEDYFEQTSLEPADVCRQWAFDGFVVSQMHGADRRGRISDRSVGKALVMSAAEITYKVPNIWGDQVKTSNQLLFFLVKGVEITAGEYRANANMHERTRLTLPKMTPSGHEFMTKPVQIVPWTSHERRWPTLSDLQYTDDYGRIKYAEVIPVGHTMLPPPTDDMKSASRAWHDAAATVDLPPITIMQNPHLSLINLF